MPEAKIDTLAPEELEQVPEHLEDEEAEGATPGAPVKSEGPWGQGNVERLSMLHQLARRIA